MSVCAMWDSCMSAIGVRIPTCQLLCPSSSPTPIARHAITQTPFPLQIPHHQMPLHQPLPPHPLPPHLLPPHPRPPHQTNPPQHLPKAPLLPIPQPPAGQTPTTMVSGCASATQASTSSTNPAFRGSSAVRIRAQSTMPASATPGSFWWEGSARDARKERCIAPPPISVSSSAAKTQPTLPLKRHACAIPASVS